MTLYGTRGKFHEAASARRSASRGQTKDHYKTRRAPFGRRRGVYDGNFPALVVVLLIRHRKEYGMIKNVGIGKSPGQSPFGEFA